MMAAQNGRQSPVMSLKTGLSPHKWLYKKHCVVLDIYENDHCYKLSSLKKNWGKKKSILSILEQLAFRTGVPKVASTYVISHEKSMI